MEKFERPELTIGEMRRFTMVVWGRKGQRIHDRFCEFNDQFFDNAIRPLPILRAQAAPYGHWVGLCCGNSLESEVQAIYLTEPRDGTHLLANAGVLLHEMVHAFLMQRGESTKHADEPWRREITRISESLGHTILALPTQVKKDRETRKSYRYTPEGSLSQKEIAGWPRCIGELSEPL